MLVYGESCPRLHLFELEDQPSFPVLLCDLATDYLSFIQTSCRLDRSIRQVLLEALRTADAFPGFYPGKGLRSKKMENWVASKLRNTSPASYLTFVFACASASIGRVTVRLRRLPPRPAFNSFPSSFDYDVMSRRDRRLRG